MPFKNREKTYLLFPGILGIFIVILGIGEARWLTLENMGSETVRAVSSNPEGYLNCQRLSQGIGDASVTLKGYVKGAQPNEANLKYSVCQELFSWLQSDRKTITDDQLLAVHVLVHESFHVAGDYNETSTECKTEVALPGVLKEMGAPEHIVASVPAFYEEKVRPYLGSEYKAAPCGEFL